MNNEHSRWLLDEVRCKKCRICFVFCPTNSIKIVADGTPHMTDETTCSKCGLCERWCPDFAITVGGCANV